MTWKLATLAAGLYAVLSCALAYDAVVLLSPGLSA